MQSPTLPVTSSLLGPNILLNTMFSNTRSILSSLNVSDQVSHPCKTTGKFIVLYILIFKFLDSNLEDNPSLPLLSQITHDDQFHLAITPRPSSLHLTDNSACQTIHSFHWHAQNATIPCCSQEPLPFLSVMYFFLPPISTN